MKILWITYSESFKVLYGFIEMNWGKFLMHLLFNPGMLKGLLARDALIRIVGEHSLDKIFACWWSLLPYIF